MTCVNLLESLDNIKHVTSLAKKTLQKFHRLDSDELFRISAIEE